MARSTGLAKENQACPRLPLRLPPGKMRRGRRSRADATPERRDSMNGAESLVRALVGGGADMCFANPVASGKRRHALDQGSVYLTYIRR
jgi:hypothetical protein